MVRGQVQGLPALGSRPRLFRASRPTRPAVEAAQKAKGGKWPSQDDVIEAMPGLEVESLGGKGRLRKDTIAEQTFVQGFIDPQEQIRLRHAGHRSTRCTRADLQKPPGANFWEWIKTAQIQRSEA